MLINGREGILSVGGTGAPAVDLVVKQTKDELDRVGALERQEVPLAPTEDDTAAVPEGQPLTKRGGAFEAREASWKDGWEWSTVQGAEGWWQILMQGVWVDDSKVLQNQAVVLDVCPSLTTVSSSENQFTDRLTDQLPVHPCTSFSCQSLLCLDLWLASAACTVLQLLRLPLPESTNTSF